MEPIGFIHTSLSQYRQSLLIALEKKDTDLAIFSLRGMYASVSTILKTDIPSEPKKNPDEQPSQFEEVVREWIKKKAIDLEQAFSIKMLQLYATPEDTGEDVGEEESTQAGEEPQKTGEKR